MARISKSDNAEGYGSHIYAVRTWLYAALAILAVPPSTKGTSDVTDRSRQPNSVLPECRWGGPREIRCRVHTSYSFKRPIGIFEPPTLERICFHDNSFRSNCSEPFTPHLPCLPPFSSPSPLSPTLLSRISRPPSRIAGPPHYPVFVPAGQRLPL